MPWTAVNLSYVGNGPSASGQAVASSFGGPRAKQLVGYATVVGDGSSAGGTVNFIDGTAKLGQKNIVLSIQSIDASDGTNSVYHSVNADTQIAVGDLVTVTGCSVSANNVSAAAVAAVSASTVTVANASGTAESGLLGAVMVDSVSSVPKVAVSVGGANSDSALHYAKVSALTATGFTLTFDATTTGSAKQDITVIIAPTA